MWVYGTDSSKVDSFLVAGCCEHWINFIFTYKMPHLLAIWTTAGFPRKILFHAITSIKKLLILHYT
jgi:hypothetical protein